MLGDLTLHLMAADADSDGVDVLALTSQGHDR